MSSTTFKKRAVPPAHVESAQDAAASSQTFPTVAAAAAPEHRPAAIPVTLSALHTYQIGQTYEVPLGRVKSNPVNPRAHYTLTAVDQMSESLQQVGQLNACTGFASEDGTVTLIEGETRFRGARACGRETLRIEIRPKPSDDRHLYEEARATNVERRAQTVLDDATRWRELLQRGVYATQRELAEALKHKEDEVSRIVQLGRLPQRLIHELIEREINDGRRLNAIREYWDSMEPADRDQKTLDLIEQVAKQELSYRDIEARRKAEATGPRKRSRGDKQMVPFAVASAKGELKSYPDGRLEFSVRGLEEAEAARFQEGLKELCARIGKPA